MIRFHRVLALLALVALAACRGDPGGAEGDAGAGERGPHAQRLLFVGGSAEDPWAAVFVFGAERRGPELARTARAWASGPAGWESLLDSSWETEPIREPWRPVPHGPLRLILRDDGALAPVVQNENGRVRLLPRAHVGDAEDAPGVTLRDAVLEGPAEAVDGAVLEERTSGGAPYEAYALLTDGAGLRAVVTRSGVWIHEPEGERTWREAGLQRAAADSAVWRLAGVPDGGGGELRAVEPAGEGPDSLALVRGWLDVGRGRRTVFGLLSSGAE